MPSPRRATPTSSEVAQRAGVSRTTVSFVLNDVRNKGISEETRQKVLEAASELGYQPNAAARTLAGGSTGTVAVVIPRSDHLHVDAYLPRLLSTVNDCCHAHGYKVLIEAAYDQVKRPGAFMNLVRSKRIDGLVMVNMRSVECQYVRQLAKQGFPIVVPGNGLESFYSRCTSDNDVVTAYAVTRHLLDLGHRRIAHIPFAPKDYEAVILRRAGYEQALAEGGIAPDPKLVVCADISARSGYDAMQKLLARKVSFTALFAGNDTIAFGAMRALVEAGRSIPRDVAVVGYDDIPLAAFATPSLTTLRIDPVTQGQEAVDMLLAQINGEDYARLEIPYATRLIIRESCGFSAAGPASAS
jgi:DNA-binding LacI/PurR family transcriptional regulator